jgi:hypothetical protein
LDEEKSRSISKPTIKTSNSKCVLASFIVVVVWISQESRSTGENIAIAVRDAKFLDNRTTWR